MFLALLLLVLALGAPERMHTRLAPRLSSMRGPLISLDEHPQWRQLLMQAAIRRADELSRLRDLLDTPVHSKAPPALQIARLPAERVDADPDPDDESGLLTEPPPATIPIDIGEASSIELPVAAPDEPPPVIRTPLRLKPGDESRVKGVKRARRAKLIKPKPPAQVDLFKAMFGDQKSPPRAVSASAVVR
ncbi:MAG TPA: hypothetical protein VL048_12375 [Xanthobacteraceae bacterium]|nr:hypothetical protein [Xanthobacteraceae bacterium]